MCGVSENEIVESKQQYVDNGWPFPDGEHAVSEFAAGLAGALSPFGATELPLPPDELLFTNPSTVINT